MPVESSKQPLERIGPYQIILEVAEGAMGRVYKARHLDTGGIVALKVIAANLVENPVMIKRFEQEFRAAHALDHPHIVRGLEFGEEGGVPYFVMEFVDGENLGQCLDRVGRLPEAEAVRLISQAAEGLHQAHLKGIIHRDVKPDNILVNQEGQAKLSDLGLVKDLEGELNLTRTGRGLGTPYFMAPEQFRHAKNADLRCDIYSLGATLYMMVTGVLPFKGCTPIDAWTRKIKNDFKRPREIVPEISETVDRAILRAMHADPKQRPGSCPEFIKSLGEPPAGAVPSSSSFVSVRPSSTVLSPPPGPGSTPHMQPQPTTARSSFASSQRSSFTGTAPAPSSAPPRPLERIGRYEILNKIAEGGMGAVYKARHRETGAVVAIKVISERRAEDPVMVKRFEKEFQVARELNHPFVVRGLDYGEEGGQRYIVMEYVDGPNLGHQVRMRGRLPEAEAIRLVTQVAQGLHQAHLQGIIHRDIKPDNILITPDGRAKLTDLGLMKDLDADEDLTRTGLGLGTRFYMAPEQFRDAKRADVRCDIYSLAATLYMLITGEMPFKGCTPVEAFTRKMKNDLPPPRSLAPQMSERTERAILQSMAPEPSQRPASCPEFIQLLTDVPVPRSPTGAPFHVERRATVRYPTDLKGACRTIGGEERIRWVAKVQDISAGGVSLLVRRRFEPKTVLSVEVRDKRERQQHHMLVRVVRVHQKSARMWTLGCVFAQPISEDEVQSLT